MKERLIDADSLLEFFDSQTSGIDEVLQDCIIKHGFTYENNFNEEKAIDLCREVIDKVKNVIYTEPVITEMDLIDGWHNLIENPDDKPEYDKDVIIELENTSPNEMWKPKIYISCWWNMEAQWENWYRDDVLDDYDMDVWRINGWKYFKPMEVKKIMSKCKACGVVNANADALKELTGMVKELEAKIQKLEEE